jgi:beta-lactamase superfamily II metal-dependent hydrolase
VNCEIEFLPVGDASKAGDAIVVRYGDEDAFELMLVDGGHAETGTSIVEHLHKYFGEDVRLAHVVLTHSDIDHASGLRTVLEEIPVDNLWIHLPWNHAAEAAHLFADPTLSAAELAREIAFGYDILVQIAELASERNIPIHWAFQGANIGPFRILSPSRRDYVRLMAQFDRTPAADVDAIAREGLFIGKASRFARFFEKAVSAARRWIPETWLTEQLKDGGVTSASNETSIVLYGDFGNAGRVLLTGDAGIRALTSAADYAEANGLPLQQFTFVQIPHHGSRSNVGPTVLDRVVGPIQVEDGPSRFSAFVSAPKDDDSHPRKIVLNAFKRRGGNVVATQGEKKVHHGGFRRRAGYVDADPIPFSLQVEQYDDDR